MLAKAGDVLREQHGDLLISRYRLKQAEGIALVRPLRRIDQHDEHDYIKWRVLCRSGLPPNPGRSRSDQSSRRRTSTVGSLPLAQLSLLCLKGPRVDSPLRAIWVDPTAWLRRALSTEPVSGHAGTLAHDHKKPLAGVPGNNQP